MRERGNGKIVIVILDPDNPDCVIEIVSSVESVAEDEQTESIRDACGYLSYIVNGEFVRNEKIALNQTLESVCVDSPENCVIGGSVKTNVPVVGKHITTGNDDTPLNEKA